MESSIYSITENSQKWPALLKELPKSAKPKKLFIRGVLPPPDTLVVAVVGTRRPSGYGRDAAEEITRTLARRGIAIASGMALGIDSIAHKTAIEEGVPTLAILGNGISEDVMYPRENILLSRSIVELGGALISEYPQDQKPELWTFPQRNRIIDGITKATVVIEAGEKSGALITARHAAEYNRDVFALPGSIYNSGSKGTNALIKEGAIPITSPDDILSALGLTPEPAGSHAESLTPEEGQILAALEESLGLDDIIRRTRLSPKAALAATSALEIRGIIKDMGGIWRKK